MSLEAFLHSCNLLHLHAVLTDAGVECFEDLQQYYEELRELVPDNYRNEMASTFRCKKIDISRLITAIDQKSR